MDDRSHIAFSAYADGELDAAAAAHIEHRLTEDKNLRRHLQQYKKLDSAAAQLPVPQAGQKAQALWAVGRASVPATALERQIAAEFNAPTISEERFRTVWQKIASRTVAPPQAELDAMLRSAAFDGEAAATGATTAENDAQFWRRLDEAARTLPVPQLNELQTREIWHTLQTAIREAAIDAIPDVAPEKWSSVWNKIAQKTTAKHVVKREAPVANVVQADFTAVRRRRWPWMAAAGLAAAAVLAILLLIPSTPEQQVVAMSIPEALDDRYDVQVQYLPDQHEPVVCFFLKDGERKPDTGAQDFHWLPD
ncbi:MAG TPA: hypothetical protein VGP72_18395 [Planctomycetota bacterium]|jgi:anti-sigma factor RsiW